MLFFWLYIIVLYNKAKRKAKRMVLQCINGVNTNLTAQKSNSNTVWFNFQTYIYIYIFRNSVQASYFERFHWSILNCWTLQTAVHAVLYSVAVMLHGL
jgi:hypothetical protein